MSLILARRILGSRVVESSRGGVTEVIRDDQQKLCMLLFTLFRFFGFGFQLPHAFVNCVECFTLKLLLEQILNKLSHLSSSKAECPTEITCETFNDFVRLFKQVTSTENLKDQTVYIVSNST